MAVFISYSHHDADFVDSLAIHLIKAKAHVWVDRWELNVGDSLLTRIEEEIDKADALVVVLSESSLESEWCRKELTAGLVRELDEKEVVVFPVLLEDCTIPLFLRDKKYADFRKDFDAGLLDITSALAKLMTDTLGRMDEASGIVDWAIEWSVSGDGRVAIHITAVDQAKGQPFTVLCRIDVRLNDVASRRHTELVHADFEPFARHLVLTCLAVLPQLDDFFVVLEDASPVDKRLSIQDPKAGLEFEVAAQCRRLGEATGRDVLLDLGKQIRGMAGQSLRTLRPAPAERKEKFVEIMRKYRQDLPF